jgi:hypothetical protein
VITVSHIRIIKGYGGIFLLVAAAALILALLLVVIFVAMVRDIIITIIGAT